MLIMSDRPIKNCLDFYVFYDPRDALSNMKDLVAFARGNLGFNEMNDACIDLLEKVSDPDAEIMCRSVYDFWQGSDFGLNVPDKKISCFLNEGFAIFSSSGPGWEKRFISYCALSIIADRLSFDRWKDTAASGRKTTALDISKDQTDVRPGKIYSCRKADLSNDLPEGFVIRTVKVSAKPGYTVPAALEIGDEKVELRSGSSLYLNVVNDAVVKVLPDETRSVIGTVHHGDDVGDGITIPPEATSFACIGAGAVVYLNANRLYTLGSVNNIPGWMTQDEASTFAEVAAVDKDFYLLTTDGIVMDSRGVTPDNMRSHYADLDKALNLLKED